MSEAEEPKKKGWFARAKLSIAAKAAIAVAICLLAVTVLAWWLYIADSSRVAWADYMTASRGITIAVLYFAAVAFTYVTARLWFEQLPASESAIEKAWRAGEQAFARRGMSIQDVPVFVVLGVADKDTMASLMNSAGERILEAGVPQTDAPIAWYLTEKAAYLFIRHASLLSKLNERLGQQISRLDAKESGSFDGESVAGNPSNRRPEAKEGDAAANLAGSLEQVAELEKLISSELSAPNSLNGEHVAPAPELSMTDVVTSLEQIELRRCITAIGSRLRATRAPVAAYNGILAFVDGRCIENSEQRAWVVGKGAAQELDLLTKSAGVHAATSFLVGGLHGHRGFQEAIRRYGAVQTKSMLVGATAEPTQLLEKDDPAILADKGLAAVKECTIALFNAAAVLSTTGNDQLVHLQVQLRNRFGQSIKRLSQELLRGRCSEPDLPKPGFVSGLFFGGTGGKESQQAFLRPLFQRMQSQQDLLAWTNAQQSQARRLKITLRILQTSFTIAIAALVIQLVA